MLQCDRLTEGASTVIVHPQSGEAAKNKKERQESAEDTSFKDSTSGPRLRPQHELFHEGLGYDVQACAKKQTCGTRGRICPVNA